MKQEPRRKCVCMCIFVSTSKLSNDHDLRYISTCRCFLVTYYFTQQILTQYSKIEKDAKSNIERLALDEEAKAFVKKYGAYLQLHSCLSYSAVVKAEAPIGDLLIAASHDPTHRDATKEIQRANALIFYDEVSNAQCGLSD